MLKTRIAVALLAVVAAADAVAAGRRALIIGINDYTASRLGQPPVPPPPNRDWNNLTGAVTDATLLGEMLMLVYGFTERDIVTLTDQEATREAILRAINEHLIEPAAKDDVLVFYFAGHGSRVKNSLSDEADRMDESIVPADSRLGARDIRDKELRSLFNTLLDRGARLTVILDHCHSGSAARGLPTGARPRAIKADLRDLAYRSRLPPRPEDRGALVLSATQDFDQAWETRGEDGQFHGAFSWALIRAMRDSAPAESASETFLRACARMRADTPFQEPVMAGTHETRVAPLFGGRGDRNFDRTVVAVERVLPDGTVVLQGGWANGLSIGSELRIVSERELVARLRVTEMIGLGRSQARIEPGRALPQAVKSGALLEVVGWAAPPGRPLRLWMPRVPGNVDSIAALAGRLHAEATRRGVRWVTDPLDTISTHVLRRRRSEWELLHGCDLTRFGPEPGDAIAALAQVPRGASLFVQFPAPAAMLDGVTVEGIESVDDPERADYVLLARYSSRRLQYAWLRPGVMSADRRKSGLPQRTDWVMEHSREQKLRDALTRLRRIHAWHLLDSPPGERSPYRLTLLRTRTGERAKDAIIGDDAYEVVLRSAAPLPARTNPRYVYVFVIDSHGKSTLLFPDNGSVENRVPLSTPAPREIRLGRDSAFEVAPPYGVDTFFLLTSEEALPNPWVLEWDGVRTRAPERPAGLERLLMETGTTRGLDRLVTPATWSIERVVFESVAPRRHKASGAVSLSSERQSHGPIQVP